MRAGNGIGHLDGRRMCPTTVKKMCEGAARLCAAVCFHRLSIWDRLRQPNDGEEVMGRSKDRTSRNAISRRGLFGMTAVAGATAALKANPVLAQSGGASAAR